MTTSFQPEQPHPPSRNTRGTAFYVIVGVISAILVVMLFALGAPRLFGEGEASWGLALGAGALTLLAVVGYGLAKRS